MDNKDSGIPILHIVNTVLRRRRTVAVTMIIMVLAFVIPAFVRHRRYTASASFTPQSQQTSLAAGLASQFGLDLPATQGAGESPAFYVDLLTDRPILRGAVETRYTTRTDAGRVTGTYADIHQIREETPALRREEAIRRLRKAMDVELSQRTGVVSVSVTDESAELAEQITHCLLELVNTFNLQNRQSRATAERQFTKQRLAEITLEERQAEDRLQSFLQQNRDYQNSPELTLQQSRLSRDVNLKSQLQTTLAQAYEQARIDEVRNTPVITIIEQPDIPVKPDSRGVLKRTVVGLILGTILGMILVGVLEWFAQERRSDPDALQELMAFWGGRRQPVIRRAENG